MRDPGRGMRIAIFADSYKPYISGVTISIETLVKDLRSLGHKVYIFAPEYPNHIENDPDTFRLKSFATSYPGYRLALPYIKNMPEVDIIHTHCPFQIGLLAKFMAIRRKVPIVYTFHTLFTRYVHYAKYLPKSFSKPFVAFYIKWFCNLCDLILAPSQLSKRVLKKWCVTTNCEVVPTGIEIPEEGTNMQKRGLREELNIPKNAKVLVYLGRISKEKNLPFLLEAFQKLYKEELYLLLIGGGPMLVELKGMKIKNVIFTGELPHETAVKYLAAGDIFVFASKTETQGLVLAEAKSMGLPIVALYAGGLIDTVRSGIDGYLTERTLDSFIAHVNRLLKDEALCKKMGELAAIDSRERFSSIFIAKRIETLYNSLIKK